MKYRSLASAVGGAVALMLLVAPAPAAGADSPLIDAIKAVTDLLTATNAEPTGVPAADATPLVKLATVYMMLRNKVTVTASKKTFFGDDDAAEFEKDLSDDGTTYTETEVNAV